MVGDYNPEITNGSEVSRFITGAAGFIGFHMAKLLLERGQIVWDTTACQIIMM